MSLLDQVSCLFLIGFAVLIGCMSLRLGIGGLELMGAGFMPFLASIMLFVLSLIVLVKGLWTANKLKREKNQPDLEVLEKPAMLILGLIVYAFLLKPLGYLIMTFILIFFLFFIIQPKKWRTDLCFAALVAILSFVLFDVWLNVRLPAGLLTMIR